MAIYRTTLGDFELTVVSDGTYFLDGGGFFGVVPKVLWSKKITADEHNRVHAGLNSLLVRTGKQNILIETGIGNKLSDKMVRIYGQPALLLDNLSALGVAPEDIDIVINSHLHFDHCGWNTVRNQDGRIVPTFPRAKYYAPEGEWQYARHPSERDAISFIAENYDPLVESGRMTLLRGGEEIVPGISVRTYPGHTAHMQAVMVTSGAKAPAFEGPETAALKRCATQNQDSVERRGFLEGTALAVPSGREDLREGTASAVPLEPKIDGALAPADVDRRKTTTACYISDLIPTSHHLDLTWGMAFDLYPLQTIESRKLYYAEAIPERWLTVFTHDHAAPWGVVEKDEKGKPGLADIR